MTTKERQRSYAYFGIGALIIGGVLGGNAYLKMQPKQNAGDGCFKVIERKTVILLDHSEDVTEQTKVEVMARATHFVDSLVQTGDLVSVFSVSDLSKRNLQPQFMRCKPKAEGNSFVENARSVEKKFKQVFEIPLREVFDSKITGSRESPIAQALIDLSLSEYLRGAKRANLVVFSDMIENTKNFSMYNCKSMESGLSDFKKSRAGAVQRPTFENVSVYLNIVPRQKVSPQAIRCRDAFWAWFFGDNTGVSAKLLRDDLPG